MVFWGICLRVVFGLHATWLVNSATHMWGSRRFETRDDSRNSWWVALLTFGEGWHNNHHAHPVSARHGLAWYEFDISWITLKLFRAHRAGVGRQGREGRAQLPVEEAASSAVEAAVEPPACILTGCILRHDHRPAPIGHLLHRPRRLPRRPCRHAQRQLDRPQLAPRSPRDSRRHLLPPHHRRAGPEHHLPRPRNPPERAARLLHQRRHPRAEDAGRLDPAVPADAADARAGRRQAARVLSDHARGQRPAAAHHRSGAARRAAPARGCAADARARVDLAEITRESRRAGADSGSG